MNTPSRSDLIEALERLTPDLNDPLKSESAVQELIAVARALEVPTQERRDDAPVFLDGTESIDTATWTQCGGILFAIGRGEAREPGNVAAYVARRLIILAPAHR